MKDFWYDELLAAAGVETEKVPIKTKEEAEELRKQGIQCMVYAIENKDGYGYYLRRRRIEEEDIDPMFKVKLLKTLTTIKKCLIFFVALAAASLIVDFVVNIGFGLGFFDHLFR